MNDKMIKIAGVRFRENWKVYDFDASDVDVAVGDRVIVDTDRGQGFASVVRLKRQQGQPLPPEPVSPRMEQGLQVEEETAEVETPKTAAGDKQEPKTLRKVLRKATEEDLLREEKNREREAEAFTVAQDVITARELPMKLIRVEYSFDASRATFFFFSETRIDFRELVKDLAYKLRSRIEMRQIGVRDVARMIGGFGPCGRELCCASFLKNFEPVSIRMAKKQDMVLNPAKISGVCGRLLCCLSYEYEMYDEIKKDVAGMREAAVKEKKEIEDRRLAEEQQERKEAEERRLAEEKKRQEDRRQQEQRRDRQKDPGRKAPRPERKKEAPQEKKGPPEQQPQRQQPQPPKQEKPRPPEQAAQQPQEGEKTGRRKRRRFWRKKKKGPEQGGTPNPPKAE